MSRKNRVKKLNFNQPPIKILVPVKVTNKKRRFNLAVESRCRALLCSKIHKKLQPRLVRKKADIFEDRDYWRDRGKDVYERLEGVNLDFQGAPIPAKLSIHKNKLATLRKGRYREYTYPAKPVISLQRVRDFYYLADLLCGTFGVLLGPPRDKQQNNFARPEIKKINQHLTYSGVDAGLLRHPAMLSLFLGQLRLASLLVGIGETANIRKKVSDRELKRALTKQDRKTCIQLLRKVEPWILRSESGEWSFQKSNSVRFRKLLTYLGKGNAAEELFGSDAVSNWLLTDNDYFGVDFHNHGFKDFMRVKGDLLIGTIKHSQKKKKS